MKIGIITFHDALNCGAILQAYALQTFLEKNNIEVEFINYSVKKYPIRSIISRKPLLMIKRIMDLFFDIIYTSRGNWNKVLNVSKTKYHKYLELENNPPIYDLYITGSDQVWNFKSELDPGLLLNFVPVNLPKISYAASLGNCRIENSKFEEFKNHLSTFSGISIREASGCNFLNDILGKKCNIVQCVDPTLLISNSSYESIEENITINEKYIVSYILNSLNSEQKSIINYIRHEYNTKHINLRNPSSCEYLNGAQNIIVTPYEWLSYIKHSEFVICASFHAIVFSLIYKKRFIAITSNERIRSILKMVNLEHLIIESISEIKSINTEIDWIDVNIRIKRDRLISEEYLKNFIPLN